MKAKTVVITVLVVGGLTTASIVAVRKLAPSSIGTMRAVKVVPVSSVVDEWMAYDDEYEGLIYGSIESRSIQRVQLDNDLTVEKVYVNPGDVVKVGDPLMKYDMTLLKLQREREDLRRQQLEINLKKQEKALAKLKSNPNAAYEEPAQVDEAEDDDAELTGSADLPLEAEELIEDPGSEEAADGLITDEMSGDGLIEEEDDEAAAEMAGVEELEKYDSYRGEGSQRAEAAGNADGVDDQVLLDAMTRFMQLERDIAAARRQETAMEPKLLEEALGLFTQTLAATPLEAEGTLEVFGDLTGQERREPDYMLSPAVLGLLSRLENQAREEGRTDGVSSAETQITLYRAFANVCYYDLLEQIERVKEEAANDEGAVSEEAAAALLDSYYRFKVNWFRIQQVLEKRMLLVSGEDKAERKEAVRAQIDRMDASYQEAIEKALELEEEESITKGLRRVLQIESTKLPNSSEEENAWTRYQESAEAESGSEPAGDDLAPQNMAGDGTDPQAETGDIPGADPSRSPADGKGEADPDQGTEPGEDIGGEDLIDPDNGGNGSDTEVPGGEIVDSGDEWPGETEDLIEDPSVEETLPLPGENPGESGAETSLQREIYKFLLMESYLRSGYSEDPSQLKQADIDTALSIYQTSLAGLPSEENGTAVRFAEDVLKNERLEGIYLLRDEVVREVESMEESTRDTGDPVTASEMITSLYRGYANVCFYNVVSRMNTLQACVQAATDAGGGVLSGVALKNLQGQIGDAVDAYYKFDVNWNGAGGVSLKDRLSAYMSSEAMGQLSADYVKALAPYAGSDANLEKDAASLVPEGSLSRLVRQLLQELLIEDETERPTEPNPDGGDGYDGDDGDAGSGFSKEEYEAAIRVAEEAIAEYKLQLRESELKLRQYDRKLEKETVKATIAGVVKEAGSENEGGLDDAFITVTGDAGMYAVGSVGELELDTVKVGDVVTGTCDDNGVSFTAKITEISEYPKDGSDDSFGFWGWGMDAGNSNVSKYPFYAYIEDSEDIIESSASMKIQKSDQSKGFYISDMMVRTDVSGRPYVFVKGKDGLLTQQYVRTGSKSYGSIEILGGLSQNAMIAFPYGTAVVEGARTVDADSLYEEYYE
ncbi:MAG: hypothetical protein Q4B59_02380 [Lachnospiraceae bacterium]|nr:hypothetical protein [Lachnospiraceae bacterium]